MTEYLCFDLRRLGTKDRPAFLVTRHRVDALEALEAAVFGNQRHGKSFTNHISKVKGSLCVPSSGTDALAESLRTRKTDFFI